MKIPDKETDESRCVTTAGGQFVPDTLRNKTLQTLVLILLQSADFPVMTWPLRPDDMILVLLKSCSGVNVLRSLVVVPLFAVPFASNSRIEDNLIDFQFCDYCVRGICWKERRRDFFIIDVTRPSRSMTSQVTNNRADADRREPRKFQYEFLERFREIGAFVLTKQIPLQPCGCCGRRIENNPPSRYLRL